MQAAFHWHILSQDVANRINNQLLKLDDLNYPVFVRETCGSEDTPCAPGEVSGFDEAFRDLLITDLVNLGVPVIQSPDDDTITINYKVQLVHHRAKRLASMKPGSITVATLALQVIRDLPSDVATVLVAAGIDLVNQNSVTSGQYDIIITTSMARLNNYIYKASDLYYINDKDVYQYQ